MLLGIGVHLWGKDKVSIDKHLEAVRQGGFQIIRWDVPWKVVEKTKGQFNVPENWDYIVNKGNALGIQSLLILDYGNKFYDQGDKPVSPAAVAAFVRYSIFLAHHFKGRVKYYQVWNEWDGVVGDTTNGRAKDYASLLKPTYQAIKSIDKNAVVIGGSFSTGGYDALLGLTLNAEKQGRQVEWFFNEGVSDYMDVIAIHPYVVYRSIDLNSYEGFVKVFKTMLTKIRATPGFENKPIFITELGWSTASGDRRGVSEQDQKKFMLDARDLANKYGISSFIAYELIDVNRNSDDLESNFGFLRFNWSKKPIFDVFCRDVK